MNVGLFLWQYCSTVASRRSPISLAACLWLIGLAAVGVAASLTTQFTFASVPDIWELVAVVVVLDFLCQFVPPLQIVNAAQTVAHGLLFLVMFSMAAVLAAYSLQRLAFPLQDHLFKSIDEAFGLSWPAYAHWVDSHLGVQRVFRFAYDTVQIQTALPLVVLAFANRRHSEVRAYLLAFAIALSATLVISALMPGGGPIVWVDRTSFEILGVTGATPLDHLTRLREAGPFVLSEPPGGIATFPSFHATVAVLVPLTLRKHRRTLFVLLVLNAAMLGGTITEGAHYFCDLVAGSAMAFFAHAVATSIIRMEDRLAPSVERRTDERAAPGCASGQPIAP
jgi:membrane-associated phospholipid phosphatase